jgi:hypothetical protein
MFRYNLPVPSSGGQESKRFVFVNSWPPKMGQICYSDTSVRNYHYSLRNIPEKRISQETMYSPKHWYSHLLWHCAITKDYTMSMVTLICSDLMYTLAVHKFIKRIRPSQNSMRQNGDKKFRSEDLQLLSAILKDLLHLATSRLGFLHRYMFIWRHPVAYLVEALRYNSEGRGFDSRWCHWNFSLT